MTAALFDGDAGRAGIAGARVDRTLADLVPGGRYSGSTGASDVVSSDAGADLATT